MSIKILSSLALVSALWFLVTSIQQWRRVIKRKASSMQPSVVLNPTGQPTKSGPKGMSVDLEKLSIYKDLYYRLQNLERYPEVLSGAQDLLTSILQESLEQANQAANRSILSVETHTQQNLLEFLKRRDESTTQKWEEYLARRTAGTRRELFVDKASAVKWLKTIAPVKLIDGAWLGHINKITTPFPLRRVTKDAWQILSEELGDGDLLKNHVFVFRKLLEEVDVELPEGDSAEFVQSELELNESRIWGAAIAQLLVSLFPHKFLPEILGFNMHFELLTLETLIVSKELAELKIDPYYFILHVSIDNADSGHTAIAMQAVNKLIQHTRDTEGVDAADRVWKRVQAGFLLSEHASTVPASVGNKPPAKSPAQTLPSRGIHDVKVLNVFRSKASAAHKIHCICRLRIGGRSLVDWLDPTSFASEQWQSDFLDALSCCKPWVHKGDSSRSKLVQELTWGGKMFGAFTNNETELVRNWIDSIPQEEHVSYWSLIDQKKNNSGLNLQYDDIRQHYPVFAPFPIIDLLIQEVSPVNLSLQSLQNGIEVTCEPDLSQLLPLWFTAPCLLEGLISNPAKTATRTGCAVVRILRAQAGFNIECPGVSGMDEARREDSMGLLELGLEMSANSLSRSPESLKQVLDLWPSTFSLGMLHLSMRPLRNIDLLLGMTWGFVELHHAMAKSTLLSDSSKEVLHRIASREQAGLNMCLDELRVRMNAFEEFGRGLILARAEIEHCFRPAQCAGFEA